MSLWDLEDFEGLLSRIEAQHRQWQKARLQRRDADGRGHIRARARQGTRNGVYKKSVQRVTSYFALFRSMKSCGMLGAFCLIPIARCAPQS